MRHAGAMACISPNGKENFNLSNLGLNKIGTSEVAQDLRSPTLDTKKKTKKRQKKETNKQQNAQC